MAASDGDILRVSIKWRHAVGGDQVNTYNLVCSDVIDGTNEDILDAVTLWAKHVYNSSGVTALMSAALTHQEISVFNYESGGFPIGYTGAVSDLNGTNAVESLPTITAALIVERTGVSRVVGRKYIPTLGESCNNAGRVDSGCVVVLQVMANRLAAPYDAPGLMTFTNYVRAADGLSGAAVTSALPRSDWARIGSRKPGRGS